MDAFEASPAYQELFQSLRDIQQRFFANQDDVNLQTVCEELVQSLKCWWRPGGSLFHSMRKFRFLVKCNIAERLNALGDKRWRIDVANLLHLQDSDDLDWHYQRVHSKLVTYEREYQPRFDAAFLLELAIWKSKIDESRNMRGQCRINCGAEVIIPNVLPYLFAKKEVGNDSCEDESMDESSDDGDSDGMDESSE